MKSLELNAWGLEEVSINEAIAINGGEASTIPIPWPVLWKILMALGDIATGVAAGYYLHQAISEDAVEIYGGELDPAICVG